MTARNDRLPDGFRFLVVRRISQKLAWAYVRVEQSGHWFLLRGSDALLPVSMKGER